MRSGKRRRRGMTLVEVLTALPLFVLLSGGALFVMQNAVGSFHRNEDYVSGAGWSSAERVFAFLETPVKHCGVGLPERWQADLFSPPLPLYSMPAWSLWQKGVSVGDSVDGYGFRSTGAGWGNTLRLVSCMPTGNVVLKELQAEANVSVKSSFSGAVKEENTVDARLSVSWLLFPGTEVPVRIVREAAGESPTVTARAPLAVPWGTPVCRLLAMKVFVKNGTVYVDYHDGSHEQPMFHGVQALGFRLDEERRLLGVKVQFAAGEKALEASRTWKLGL